MSNKVSQVIGLWKYFQKYPHDHGGWTIDTKFNKDTDYVLREMCILAKYRLAWRDFVHTVTRSRSEKFSRRCDGSVISLVLDPFIDFLIR